MLFRWVDFNVNFYFCSVFGFGVLITWVEKKDVDWDVIDHLTLLLPATAFCWNVPPLISHLLPLPHVPPLIPSLLGDFLEVYLLQIHAYIIRTYTKISLSQTYTDRQCLYKRWWVLGKRVKLWQSDKAKGAVMTYLTTLDYDKHTKGWTCSEICFQGFKVCLDLQLHLSEWFVQLQAGCFY